MTDKSMPIVYKHEMLNEADFEDQISFRNLKIQNFSENCNGTERRKPKRSTLGISAFTTNDTTPNADRFIAKRRGRDSNALISQIIKKESAVDEINRNDFEDMDEYEEKKREQQNCFDYRDLIKDNFWNNLDSRVITDENPCTLNYIDRANDHVSKKNLEFNDKILRFTSKKPQIEGKKVTDFNNSLKFRNFKINKMCTKNEESIEFIQAEKVLDAPFMLDDMYLNLLDWNHQNLLAIALSKIVYIMNVSNRNVSPIQPQTKDCLVTSISWSSIDNCIAIGLENGIVEIWDAVKVKLVRKLYGHEGRVSSISWNKDIISTGGHDTLIINHDLKDRNHIISTFEDHYSEVCALKWSFDGNLLASGSNDNSLCIWDINNQKKPNHVLTKHRGAVKALAWCPIESNLLASGGGSDKYMRFWNADTGSEICGIETGSQVCSLIWSKNSYELISAHGFETNQMFAWKFNSKNLRCPIVKTAELYGHEMRVLHLAINPEGTTVASASPDETLRFWKVFQSNEEENVDDSLSIGSTIFSSFLR